jgi:hypothetical protein
MAESSHSRYRLAILPYPQLAAMARRLTFKLSLAEGASRVSLATVFSLTPQPASRSSAVI